MRPLDGQQACRHRLARAVYAIAVATGPRLEQLAERGASHPPPQGADPTPQSITCGLEWDDVVRFGCRIHHIGAS